MKMGPISSIKMKQIFCLLIFASIFQKILAEESFYRAAVFEYHSLEKGSSALEIIDKNLDNYIFAIKKAKSHKTDIIVFPERGLLINKVNRSTLALAATQLPNPKDEIAPCTDEQYNYQAYVKRLSCAARSSSIYLVVNLLEKELDNAGSPNGERYFDTNVVFDRDGKVISTYRKYNVYNTNDSDGDDYLNKPQLDLSTFTTDFGVTFGHFICFDILFKSPGLDLVNRGITDFVFPTWWFSELPFLTAIEVQTAFSYAHKVNLLAANINFPEIASTGSGIYSSSGALVKLRSDVPKNALLIAAVPKIGTLAKSLNFSHVYQFSQDEMPILNDKSNEEINWLYDNLTKYKTINLNEEKGQCLEFNETVCYDTFCCHFHVSGMTYTPKDDNYYRYKLVIFNGTRYYGSFKGGIEVCGIIACINDNITSCGRVTTENLQPGIQFDSIAIERRNVSEHVNIFPVTLLTNLQPVESEDLTFVRNEMKTVQMKLLTRHENVFSFAIYGRDETRDDSDEFH